jgi:5'-3' exonuclease
MIALIDGDVVVYRVGYTTDNDSKGIARVRANEMIEGILAATGAKEFEVYLSDANINNFRYEVSPEYKANRVDTKRPIHYEALKEHLIVDWGARIAYGMEADDMLGINQDWSHQLDEDDLTDAVTVICSIDKDLLQIPGSHYNFVKEQWFEVTQWEGLKWFYQQILIGDVTDNVKGCRGIGPVKSGRIIGAVSSGSGEEGLFEAVHQTYRTQEGKSEKNPEGKSEEEILKSILVDGRLLKIKQTEGEALWDFPSSTLTEELRSAFIQPKQVEPTPSTEPTRLLECGSQSLGKSMESIVPASVPTSISVKQ